MTILLNFKQSYSKESGYDVGHKKTTMVKPTELRHMVSSRESTRYKYSYGVPRQA